VGAKEHRITLFLKSQEEPEYLKNIGDVEQENEVITLQTA